MLKLSVRCNDDFFIPQKDLIRRLRKLNQVLETDESICADSPEWPGVAATAAVLLGRDFLGHADKQVRLYTVLACMELFAIVRIRYLEYC
jgi:hypothetical protein